MSFALSTNPSTSPRVAAFRSASSSSSSRGVRARRVVVVRRANEGEEGTTSGGDNSSGDKGASDDASTSGAATAVTSSSSSSAEDIGAAIRAAKEAKADEGTNIFAGAAEEVGLIEWPSVGGALSTTALVMAGIFGSAGVLLGVNKVLSELSQRFFP